MNQEGDEGKDIQRYQEVPPERVYTKRNMKAEVVELVKIKVIYKTVKGWVVNPKGMLQILWERGFIDKHRLKKYYI